MQVHTPKLIDVGLFTSIEQFWIISITRAMQVHVANLDVLGTCT